MIFHAYSSLVLYVAADEAVTSAQEKLDSCRHRIELSSSLPPEVEIAFQRLDHIVQVISDEPLGELMLGFPASPPMRYGYERAASDSSPSFHSLKVKMGRLSAAWRVQVLFRTLLSPDQQKKVSGGISSGDDVLTISAWLEQHGRGDSENVGRAQQGQ
jgi:hypothetical protein